LPHGNRACQAYSAELAAGDISLASSAPLSADTSTRGLLVRHPRPSSPQSLAHPAWPVPASTPPAWLVATPHHVDGNDLRGHIPSAFGTDYADEVSRRDSGGGLLASATQKEMGRSSDAAARILHSSPRRGKSWGTSHAGEWIDNRVLISFLGLDTASPPKLLLAHVQGID
jgi:hypothetical protein